MENNIVDQNQPEQQDFLEYETDSLFQHQYATQGQRFVNWLVDNLLMRFAFSYITSYGVVLILNEVSPDTLYDIVYGGTTGGLLLLAYIVGIFNYLIYYTICEKLFKGYTLGKLISGTRAIRQDGGELTFRNAFLRSLSRLVPFEVFSGFSSLTWHDQWTGTMVVKAR
jgi:uncharacterized RDD family membrane protein YckC